MEEFEKNFQIAIKSLKIADHMAYITYPLVTEHRLILKIFDEIYNSVINCINTILNYEYLYKRIHIYKDNQDNLRTFVKCAKRYDLNNEQIKKILEILALYKKHKESAMEFVKNEKVVILADNLSTQTLNIKKTKEYLFLAKELLLKTKVKINYKS